MVACMLSSQVASECRHTGAFAIESRIAANIWLVSIDKREVVPQECEYKQHREISP